MTPDEIGTLKANEFNEDLKGMLGADSEQYRRVVAIVAKFFHGITAPDAISPQ